MREAALRALPSLEIDHARDGIGAIFDRRGALGDADIADQPGRQQAQVDASVPGHGERRAVEKHLRLAFLRAANARHRLAARIGAHGHPCDAAQHIGKAARLAIDKLVLRDHGLRRQHPPGLGRGSDGDRRQPGFGRRRSGRHYGGSRKRRRQTACSHSAAGSAAGTASGLRTISAMPAALNWALSFGISLPIAASSAASCRSSSAESVANTASL